MTEHVQMTINLVQQQIENLEREVIEKKRMVNSLCALIGQAPIYTDAQLVASTGMGPTRSDEYYGQGLSTAIRMVLERRQLAKRGPAAVNEIYDALIAGGYSFKTTVEEHAKRGLYSTLTKNTATFHKLPNGLYGLLDWYPNVKEAKVASKAAKANQGDQVASDDDLDEDEPISAAEAAEAIVAGCEPAEPTQVPRNPR